MKRQISKPSGKVFMLLHLLNNELWNSWYIYFELSTINWVHRPESHFCIVIVVCKIMPPPQDVHILFPRAYAQVIKVKDLEMGE